MERFEKKFNLRPDLKIFWFAVPHWVYKKRAAQEIWLMFIPEKNFFSH